MPEEVERVDAISPQLGESKKVLLKPFRRSAWARSLLKTGLACSSWARPTPSSGRTGNGTSCAWECEWISGRVRTSYFYAFLGILLTGCSAASRAWYGHPPPPEPRRLGHAILSGANSVRRHKHHVEFCFYLDFFSPCPRYTTVHLQLASLQRKD